MALADNLRTLREKKDFSQKELAEMVGINQSSIALYEKGAREPVVSTAVAIAKKLDTTAEQLVDGQTGEENGKESNLERQM